MTVNEFIKELQSIRDDLKDKEIKVVAQNGLLFTPEIKYKLKNDMNPLDKNPENVEVIVLTV